MTMTMATLSSTRHPLLLFVLLLLTRSCCVICKEEVIEETPTCSVTNENERDPALQEMTYDVGDGPKTAWVYVEPDVASFYAQNGTTAPTTITKVVPKHNGFAGKFINLSNQKVSLYWEERAGGPSHLMRGHAPFTASGTATFPGHRFFFAKENQPDQRLQEFVVQSYPENIYVYDPYFVPDDQQQTAANLAAAALDANERANYEALRRTLAYNEQYKAFTGRSYLANYRRPPPTHHLWRADYYGQEHWVTTSETHFVQEPPAAQGQEKITMATYRERRLLDDHKKNKGDSAIALKNYREPNSEYMNMTLKVLSCAPRVFEINNFLSETEVNHIVKLASGIDLKLSTTGDLFGKPGEKPVEEGTRRTRTSYNSWVERERTPIIDAIYRRAADLLRIDEALLRHRENDEYPDLGTSKPLAESLQLVHYGVTQEYTAHHDFGFSNIDDERQGARFATLLLYLNEGMKGGETSFPRWVNAETFRELKVSPKVGKAVLFYSQLPDGNLDDFSHHAAKPVTDGEKWLINLWVWDPIYHK